jgi:hypothetical protein
MPNYKKSFLCPMRGLFGHCIRVEVPVQLPGRETGAGAPAGCPDAAARRGGAGGFATGRGKDHVDSEVFTDGIGQAAGLVVSTGILGDGSVEKLGVPAVRAISAQGWAWVSKG